MCFQVLLFGDTLSAEGAVAEAVRASVKCAWAKFKWGEICGKGQEDLGRVCER